MHDVTIACQWHVDDKMDDVTSLHLCLHRVVPRVAK